MLMPKFCHVHHAAYHNYLKPGSFARSANLPEKLYILPMFFLYLVIFLVVAPGVPLAQKPMDRSSPKFQDW